MSYTCAKCGTQGLGLGWPDMRTCPKCAPPSYINFVPGPPKPKTQTWSVVSRDQQCAIGAVRWHGPWRKYCFFPEAATVFEEVCLRDIANFCQDQTKLHRHKLHRTAPAVA